MENPDLGAAREATSVVDRLLAGALPHVAFDGWSESTFQAAAREAGIGQALARVLCPRGALDLAVAYHRQGDARMVAELAAGLPEGLRFRDRIAHAVRLRLASADREVVRRGIALFALPQNASTGSRLVWDTADAIWRALGDRSEDVNWYTKRASLGAVYSATLLYWLGDDSEDHAATWAFLDRRIEDVMRIETLKARLKEAPLVGRILNRVGGMVHPPAAAPEDLAGQGGR